MGKISAAMTTMVEGSFRSALLAEPCDLRRALTTSLTTNFVEELIREAGELMTKVGDGGRNDDGGGSWS